MKYTWRVATETLRMYPPVFCSFRQALKDIEFGGYVIPKGWQVRFMSSSTTDPIIFFNEQRSLQQYHIRVQIGVLGSIHDTNGREHLPWSIKVWSIPIWTSRDKSTIQFCGIWRRSKKLPWKWIRSHRITIHDTLLGNWIYLEALLWGWFLPQRSIASLQSRITYKNWA